MTAPPLLSARAESVGPGDPLVGESEVPLMAAQKIKYQSTTVEPWKSATEIAELVRRYGGSRFEQRWGDYGELVGIRFAIRTDEWGEVPVMLDAQTGRIEEILRAVPAFRRNADRRREQAYRIAWRQLKDFVEQALLAVETGLFPVAAAFMAHLETVDPETGERITMAQLATRYMRLEQGREALRLLPAARDY